MISAILCAAGSGTRTGFDKNKVLFEMGGVPILCYSLSALSRCDETIVVCRKEDKPVIQKLIAPYRRVSIVIGGETRLKSVMNGLREARGDIVVIHDAARPFVTKKLLGDIIQSALEHGSGVAAIPAVDTAAIVTDGRIDAVPLRESVYSLQTPQAFTRKDILSAYERAVREKRENDFSDDSGIYAAYIGKPAIVLGERSNKKLTYADDFVYPNRVGFGVDTHSFDPDSSSLPQNNFITLCGVKIPSDKRILAHSDGDVALHALMDALLSAAGLRDIGYYFPSTDEAYRGANSMQLLKKVLVNIRQRGWVPQNVSISILAEKPYISPYVDQMKSVLSDALPLPADCIGIAAGTNEKLGYIGEGKGITVYAYVSMKQKTSRAD